MKVMNSLKDVIEIVSKLTPDEKATIRIYLSVFNKKGKVPTSRSVILFDRLLNYKEGETESDIEQSVYKTSNSIAFDRLILRLRHKILEALIIDINVDREGMYPEPTKVKIEVRKNLTQAQILLERGSREIAGDIFEKVADQCEKYELYEELLSALRSLIRLRTLDSGEKKIKQLIRKYEQIERYKSAVIKAEINYHRVISQSDFRSEPVIRINWLRGILDNLSADLKKQSVQIGYFYFYIETHYYQLQRDYKNARKALLNIQRLIANNVVMKIPAVMGGILLNLADNDLYLTQFERSYTDAEKGLEFFKKDNFNYELGIELMFYAKFYEGEYEIALNTILQLFPEHQPTSNFRKGKRTFLLANCFFMLEDYQSALRHLNLLNPIETDKEGWRIGIKLLVILTFIELKRFDEAALRIDDFRRVVAQVQIKSHRAKMISQILQSLAYSGYDFKTTYKAEKSFIEMLEEKSGALSWQIKSNEMAIFPQWFFAKVSRQKFTQAIPTFQLSENKNIAIVKQQ